MIEKLPRNKNKMCTWKCGCVVIFLVPKVNNSEQNRWKTRQQTKTKMVTAEQHQATKEQSEVKRWVPARTMQHIEVFKWIY